MNNVGHLWCEPRRSEGRGDAPRGGVRRAGRAPRRRGGAPYERPPLSKDYLRGDSPHEKAYVHEERSTPSGRSSSGRRRRRASSTRRHHARSRRAPTRPYPRARCRRRLPRHPPRPRRRVPSAVPRASPSPSGSWVTDWRRPTRARSPRLPAERPRSRWTAISVPSIRARRGPSTRSRRYASTSVAGWTGTTPIGRGTDPATALASTTGRLLQGLAKRALKPKPIPAAACGPAPRRGGRALDSLERLQERASRSDSTPYRGTCSREAPSESAYVTTRSPGRRPTRRSLAQAIAEFDRYLPFGPRNDCNPHSYAVPWIPPRGFEAPPPSLARAVFGLLERFTYRRRPLSTA